MSILARYLELIRFSHTLFALPFAFLGALMAWYMNYHPEVEGAAIIPFRLLDFVGILVCMVFARSAAMTFNRIADRKIDALNPRTSSRHLCVGSLSLRSAVVFLVLSSLGFVAGTLCFLPRNPIPAVAALPVLLFLFGYSLAKRFTNLVHFWLGAALMLTPLAAWVALRGEVWVRAFQTWCDSGDLPLLLSELSPFLLAGAVLFWSAGFDIIYACMDAAFDRTHGVFSIPGRYGVPAALRLAALCHFCVLLPLLALPMFFPPFSSIWLAGVLFIALLLIYEHAIVDVQDAKKVNIAFFHVNSIISLTLLGVGGVEIFLHW
ncbi:MAG: 4-hydroxybenzoate octaprenyltransferase [Planctomycetia bacterium]|nr:4-hydroxybenzoate octaprenyltransferase [Planctomycetia bacterium]